MITLKRLDARLLRWFPRLTVLAQNVVVEFENWS